MTRRQSDLVVGIGLLAVTLVLAISIGVRGWLIDDGLINVDWTDDRIEQSIATGDEIVAALESYKSANGGYPASLDELVPVHIATIEPPVAGVKKWNYRRVPRGGYQLIFGANGAEYPSRYYTSQDGKWRVDE